MMESRIMWIDSIVVDGVKIIARRVDSIVNCGDHVEVSDHEHVVHYNKRIVDSISYTCSSVSEYDKISKEPSVEANDEKSECDCVISVGHPSCKIAPGKLYTLADEIKANGTDIVMRAFSYCPKCGREIDLKANSKAVREAGRKRWDDVVRAGTLKDIKREKKAMNALVRDGFVSLPVFRAKVDALNKRRLEIEVEMNDGKKEDLSCGVD